MSKSARKPVAILVALLLLLGTIPLFGIMANADIVPQTTSNDPLSIEITSDKNFTTLFGTIEYKVTVKNISDAALEDVSVEALFGGDLSPLAVGKDVTFAEKTSLAPGGTITLTYKATPNKLKALDVIFTPIMMLVDMIRGYSSSKIVPEDNGYANGRSSIKQEKEVKVLSIFAKYESTSTVKAYFGIPAPTPDFAKLNPEVEVLTQAQSEDFIQNAVPVELNDDGQLRVQVPAGVTYEENEIFMVLPTDDNPLGLTGKVVSVAGNELVIEQPSLGEVFSEMSVALDDTLTQDSILGTYTPAGVTQSSAAFQASGAESAEPQANFNFAKIWDLNYPLYDDGKGGKITLGGRLGFKSVDINLDAEFDIKNLKDTKIVADAFVDLYADVNLRAAGNYSFGLKSTDPLLSKGLVTPLGTFTLGGIYTENKIPLVRVIFDVGTMSFQTDIGGAWAPAMLAVSLELTTTLGGRVGGSLEMGVSYEAYVNGGFTFDNAAEDKFEWRGGIDPAAKPTAYISADGYFKGEARVGVDAAFYALGCKLAAITNDLALLGDADVNLNVSSGEQDDYTMSVQIAVKLLGEARFALKAKWDAPLGLGTISILDVDERAKLYDVTLWEKDFGARSQIADFNGHTYAVFNLAKTWAEAEAACADLGGHLVTITSAEEQAYIESLLDYDRLNRSFYWIGASRADAGSAFDWITGEAFNDYANWNSWDQYGTLATEPNTGADASYVGIWKNRNPVFMWGSDYTWFNLPLDGYAGVVGTDNVTTFSNGFICEWD